MEQEKKQISLNDMVKYPEMVQEWIRRVTEVAKTRDAAFQSSI